jgi:hypothetical protein
MIPFRVGQCLERHTRFKEASRCFEEVYECRKERLSEEDQSRLASGHALANAYLGDRRTKEAIELQHVVAVRKRILAEDDYSRQASRGVACICVAQED